MRNFNYICIYERIIIHRKNQVLRQITRTMNKRMPVGFTALINELNHACRCCVMARCKSSLRTIVTYYRYVPTVDDD